MRRGKRDVGDSREIRGKKNPRAEINEGGKVLGMESEAVMNYL